MIVICTSCRAKFRVADEKVGPRGAKVRCSKCRTVFLVHPDLGTMPTPAEPAPWPPAPPGPPASALDVELEPRPGSDGAQNPFVTNPVRAHALQAEIDDAGLGRGRPDPSAPPPAPAGRLAPPPLPPAAGLVLAPPGAEPGEPDPFAPAPAPPDDPFAPAGVDPFALAGPSPAGPALPVTDLSDLLGPGRPGAPPPPAEPAPEPAASHPEPAFPPEVDGLSLEERTTPPPVPSHGSPVAGAGFEDGLGAGAEPFSAGALDPGAFDRSAFELGGRDDGDLSLASEPAFAPAAALPPPAPPPPAAPAAAAVSRGPSDARGAVSRPAAGEDRLAGRRGSRLRALAVNAVALAVLLVGATTILVLWRSGRPLDPELLRPAAILQALGRPAAGDDPFVARRVESGLYEREHGPPLLFVRGEATFVKGGATRGERPVGPLEVRVEVVREGAVLARGEAVAGAIPTPEELYVLRDAAGVAALARKLAARAPAAVRPGTAVPFLVVIAEYPDELEGAALRVVVSPAGGGGR